MPKILTNKDNLQILYEDNHLLIINKRVGDIVQGDKTGDTPLSEILKSYIKEKYHKPGNVYLGVPHRLDRPTTGIVVFTKTSKALSRISKLFSQGQIQKTYWAVVKERPVPEKGTLVHWLLKNEKKNKSVPYSSEIKGSKQAILHYKLKYSTDNYHCLEIDLETGRHHQIRCQLASIGCPIKGDLKYGFARSNPDAGIHLHARKIVFTHPVSKAEIEIEAPPPAGDPVWKAIMNLQ
ncbi:MAG: RluA family pseudouridine synthase [Bacteroidia bacterium]|nr:RluA family pseudouridine synthase [Bacteroidia bacterium]